MSSYKANDPALRPVDPRTGEPMPAREQPGYYHGFSTLAQSPFWDEATRKTVNERLEDPPARRFFSLDEWNLWEAVFDHLIPQTDRILSRRIPIIPSLDARLAANQTAGYRYEDMPPDRDVYKLGIEAINAEALTRFAGNFVSLGHWQQEKVLLSLHDGRPQASPDIWSRMSVTRFWQLILGDAIEAYYAHPWAWDEIGFGGPAYPRAYTRLENGDAEPWEVSEKRYEWRAPDLSASDEIEPLHHLHTEAEQRSHRSPLREKG